MARLWATPEPLLVREVLAALEPERSLAYTTVMTVMDNLHRKGWLQRERNGRAWQYRPTRTQGEYTAELMREALSTSDDRGPALAQFVARMSPAEADLLRQALDDATAAAAPTPPAKRARKSRSQ